MQRNRKLVSTVRLVHASPRQHDISCWPTLCEASSKAFLQVSISRIIVARPWPSVTPQKTGTANRLFAINVIGYRPTGHKCQNDERSKQCEGSGLDADFWAGTRFRR